MVLAKPHRKVRCKKLPKTASHRTANTPTHTYYEASTDPLWQIAMKEELDPLSKNHTWDLVTLPSGKFVVGCKWIYKIKTRFDGSIEHYKARLLQKVLHKSMRLIMKRPLLRLLISHLFVSS